MHKTFKILIVEDEVLIAQDLKETLEDVGYQNVFRVKSYDQAVEILKLQNIDLVMLDINLNDKYTGLDLAEYINKNHLIPFIYLTSYSNNESIESVKHTKPVGFLLKPFSETLLLATIEIALFNFYTTKINDRNTKVFIQNDAEDFDLIVNNHLLIKDNRSFVKIPISEILWFESDKNYVEIKTNERKFIIRSSLKKILEQLPKNDFLKCHKQFIINTKQIKKVEGNNIIIEDMKIPFNPKSREILIDSIKNND
jgi:DNA-binding LytR/AlgR family response regulator